MIILTAIRGCRKFNTKIELRQEITLAVLSAYLKTTEEEHMKMMAIYDQKRDIQKSVIRTGESVKGVENT